MRPQPDRGARRSVASTAHPPAAARAASPREPRKRAGRLARHGSGTGDGEPRFEGPGHEVEGAVHAERHPAEAPSEERAEEAEASEDEGQGQAEGDDAGPGQRQEDAGRRVEVEVAALAGTPFRERERRPVAEGSEQESEDAEPEGRVAAGGEDPPRPAEAQEHGDRALGRLEEGHGAAPAQRAGGETRDVESGQGEQGPAGHRGRERDVARGKPLRPRHEGRQQERHGVEQRRQPTTAARATARDRPATPARPRSRRGRRRPRGGRASP